MPKDIKCRLCGDRDKTCNHMLSECSKLAQKEYKTRHNLVENVIYLELYKRLKCYHADKWYIHKPESVLEKMKGMKFSGILRYQRITRSNPMTSIAKIGQNTEKSPEDLTRLLSLRLQ